MFYNCSSLRSLDLSNFITPEAKSYGHMFYGCSSLVSLDISNLITSQITHMDNMFHKCSSLTSLNLSNFNTENVEFIGGMFLACVQLTSLDLSNFDTSKVTSMDHLFHNCINLEYININKFTDEALNDTTDMFNNLPNNIIVCINPNSNNQKIIQELNKKKYFYIDCSDDWKSNKKQMINCIKNCIIYEKSESQEECYTGCTQNYFDKENNDLYRCDLEKCFLCPSNKKYKGLCTICNYNYYPIENDISNIDDYFDCYQEPEGYYLDKNDYLYKKCYHTCELCAKAGNKTNHNCIKCSTNYNFEITLQT